MIWKAVWIGSECIVGQKRTSKLLTQAGSCVVPLRRDFRPRYSTLRHYSQLIWKRVISWPEVIQIELGHIVVVKYIVSGRKRLVDRLTFRLWGIREYFGMTSLIRESAVVGEQSHLLDHFSRDRDCGFQVIQ